MRNRSNRIVFALVIALTMFSVIVVLPHTPDRYLPHFLPWPPGTDIGGALDGVKDVLERRVNAFGVSETEITREGPNRLAVQMPGIGPTQARELLGKTAQLEFRAPVLDEVRNIVCVKDDG